jgi:hypothetical protein
MTSGGERLPKKWKPVAGLGSASSTLAQLSSRSLCPHRAAGWMRCSPMRSRVNIGRILTTLARLSALSPIASATGHLFRGTGISRRAEPTELPFGTTRRGATYRQSTIYQFALANEGNQATWATGPASRFPSRTNTPGIRLNLAVYSASLSTSDPTDSL